MTAKASLTQMLNVTFQRMEAGSELISVKPIMVTDMLGLPPAETSTVSAFVQSFLHEVCSPYCRSYSLRCFKISKCIFLLGPGNNARS